MTDATYVKGAELADLSITWQDSDRTPIDMSSGYTFSLKVGERGNAATFTKTTGLTGTATGLTVAWATTGELNDLERGIHAGQVTARRTSDNKERIQQFRLQIIDAIT